MLIYDDMRRGSTLSRAVICFHTDAMPANVPYAADAEISLTYDELDVSCHGR